MLDLWCEFQVGFSGVRQHGPFTKLLDLFGQIHWRILTPPLIEDEESLVHDLLAVPELTERAWLGFVGQQHRHRRTMSDLAGIDAALADTDHARLTALQLSLQGSLQSGAFLFGHAHRKFDALQTGLCPHYGVLDAPKHRVCECDQYKSARESF